MEETSQTTISTTDETRVIDVLVKAVEELKQQVFELKTQKVIDELQLPMDVLKESGLMPEKPIRVMRGKGWRPLLESEILEAQQHCSNAMDCSRYLGVDYRTYKKYAKRYGVFKINPWGKGSKKNRWAPDKGKYPLNQLLDGKFPDYPVYRLKDLLVRSGTKKAECEQCGYCERRITDNKMPLLLNFEDGNSKNHKLENIRLLCYNCTFVSGKGYIRRGATKNHFNDPDKIQGAAKKIESRF